VQGSVGALAAHADATKKHGKGIRQQMGKACQGTYMPYPKIRHIFKEGAAMGRKYYGFAGAEGLGISEDYGMVEKYRERLRKGFMCQRFDNRRDAERYAKKHYKEVSYKERRYRGRLEIDEPLYSKDVDRKNGICRSPIYFL